LREDLDELAKPPAFIGATIKEGVDIVTFQELQYSPKGVSQGLIALD